MDHDAIVVGTGYGGATAAAVLARAGLRVGILERGTWWGAFGGHRPLPETLPQVVRALEGLNLSAFGRSVRIPLSRRGLLEVHLHGTTVMMNAVAVGGTSLVNSALMQRPAGCLLRRTACGADGQRARAPLPRRRRGPRDRAGSGRRKQPTGPRGARGRPEVEAHTGSAGNPLGERRCIAAGVHPLQPLHGRLQRRRQAKPRSDPHPARSRRRGRAAGSLRGADDRADRGRLRGPVSRRAHATRRDLAGAARGPRGGHAQHAEDPVPIECRRRPREDRPARPARFAGG